MNLAEKLDEIRANAEKQIPKTALDLMHRATRELQDSGLADRIVGVGDTLPNFALPNQYGHVVASDELLAQGPLVLTVYRGMW